MSLMPNWTTRGRTSQRRSTRRNPLPHWRPRRL